MGVELFIEGGRSDFLDFEWGFFGYNSVWKSKKGLGNRRNRRIS